MKRIMVFGTFDIFHKGHEFYLTEAKKHGDELIVVVARDKNVERLKFEKPLNDENKRLKVIQDLDYVDKAVLGGERDMLLVVNMFNPDIICIGYDQNSFGIEKNYKVVKIGSFMPEIYKSSLLKK
ncbi:MAG: adenylyltransferase/cytidyltransferase family protein [archaeon]